ncbi:MAG: hypothetical protein HC919_02390 [Oscillatoriales cyanobacterium SM2_2_1]|nr:hypothetical protein [Oscillatoriales cyanobacterium SM2_2_1]
MLLERYNTTDGDAALLQIYEDTAPLNSSNPNGATLRFLPFNNPASNSNAIDTFTFSPNSAFIFRANTRYWLLLDATAGDFFWRFDSKSYASDVGVTALRRAVFSSNNGASYTEFGPEFRPRLRIRAVSFTFDGGLGLGAVMGLGWLGIRRKTAVKASASCDVG